YVSSGACVELGGTCTSDAQCGSAATCVFGTCTRTQGGCTTAADRPPGPPGEAQPIRPASPDTDRDGVPRPPGHRPPVPNADQTDIDGDGVGDACDVQICGDDMLEGTEQCDGLAMGTCPGACRADCTCVCSNEVADPKAKITLKTKNDIGKLSAKMTI